ncbi:four helix bundle protein [Shewanella psychropiezotolerans]|uniref:Four helix bundle protein n=1 Tax=Shewanella psychropiezotolerans TaxID=2593655 RepID=A0ABX5WWR2_9GAMM|nr:MULTISPECIES: four helix bundle protein [Shewanella]MPY24872.1 four helix bundle protein [Shewanella sp. YLB-07]QDO83494.1 four helix bundle protein [Shewanella psychropiezotolerans]
MRFEKLELWKKACNLSCSIYEITRHSNDYGFRDQITRAGLSIPSNIAEGVERPSAKEQIRFLYIARSSAAEVITQLFIGMKIGYINNEIGHCLIKDIKTIVTMITALIKSKQMKG